MNNECVECLGEGFTMENGNKIRCWMCDNWKGLK